ncbi:MAG: polysaccharide biosynthesis protein GtrA [Alphaproteobacteria bacterium]|nr:MAG: polysaccharide biosynthesis protein GtrA [Alphaproteobacteria bacterium]
MNEVFRFGLAGILNAAFGYSVFALLILSGAWAGAALVIGTCAGVLFNMQTSRRLVFRIRGDAGRFIAVQAALLMLNWAALRALNAIHLGDLVAQAILILPVAALSYVMQKRLVFRGRDDPS